MIAMVGIFLDMPKQQLLFETSRDGITGASSLATPHRGRPWKSATLCRVLASSSRLAGSPSSVSGPDPWNPWNHGGKGSGDSVTQLRTKHKRIIRHGVQVVDWIQHPSLVTWPNVRNIPSFTWSKLGSKEMTVKRSKVTTSCYHLISWINRSRLPIRSVESNPTCRPCALAKGAVVSIVIRKKRDRQDTQQTIGLWRVEHPGLASFPVSANLPSGNLT